MSNIVIKAEGISKSYLIDHRVNERYAALCEEFWALKDVYLLRRGKNA